MKHTLINGSSYAYRRYQDEDGLPDLLMLHGFMGDGRVFRHLTEALAPCCNPVTIDLLGHGQSDKPIQPDAYEESQQIRDLLQLARTISRRPRLLYGYSMGGRLALKATLAEPEQFDGLILESANPGIADEGQRSRRRQTDEQRAHQMRSNYQEFLSEWEDAPLFDSPVTVDPPLEKMYHMVHLEQDPAAMAASIRGFSTGLMQPLPKGRAAFSGPVLIVAGTADQKYIRLSHELAERLTGARLAHIEAGHRVHRDNPGPLQREISSFIAKKINP